MPVAKVKSLLGRKGEMEKSNVVRAGYRYVVKRFLWYLWAGDVDEAPKAAT